MRARDAFRISPTGTNPFTVLGSLRADIRKPYFSTLPALELMDFNSGASANKVGIPGKTPVGGWYTVSLNSTGLKNINKLGTTQLRLYFSLDDNNNHVADYVSFFSGDAGGADAPTLTVYYTVP